MTDPISWLRAQVDRDEAEINRHPDGEDDGLTGYEAQVETNYPCFPYLRIDKATALRQIQAHRAILNRHGFEETVSEGCPPFRYCLTCGSGEPHEYPTAWPCRTLLDIASIYSDRDGWQEEWSA